MKYYGTIANNYDIVNKGYVDANIPTKTSDLTNDSGFLSSVPIATSTTLGGVKVGSGLSITAEGLLSAVTATLASLGITASATELNYSKGVTSAIQTQLNSKIGANSPAFTGTPTAPNPATGTNSTRIATTAFVKSTISALGNLASITVSASQPSGQPTGAFWFQVV